MKFIMYHYIRPPCPDLPYFRYLELDDFRRQLDYFEATYGFVNLSDFLAILNGEPKADNGVVLTFDDGVMDHYVHVLPELERRGLWGIFYVPTGMYERGKLLDVHRIHYLLGRFGGSAMLVAARELITEDMLSHAHVDEFGHLTYARQDNDAATTEFKRMFNYYISHECRERVLNELMNRFFCERQLVDEYYIPPNLLSDMQARGIIIGGHSVNHPVFGKLSEDEQRREIFHCFDFLENAVGGLSLRTFCYPYGGFHSFTRTTEKLLYEAGCRFAMNVDPRDAVAADFQARPQALPRYDCNAFPHGQSRLQSAD
jgi:peptidoglycan/xylan/chitin deacetylase (PgdA/CDA1 family)